MARQPGIRILVLTSFATDDKVFPVIKAGVSGYLLKDSSPEELVQAIHEVYQGESSLHPSIARKVLQGFTQAAPHPSTPDALTDREMEVLGLLAQGRNNREIAKELVITDTTVRSHVSNIVSKLHLTNRTEAVLYALREGLVSLDTRSEAG